MSVIQPRGWCPTLFAPMQSGDGLLARIRPPGCILTASQARAVAAAAATFGNGIVDLGNRASVQVRGLRVDTLAAFTAAMLDAGLALPDPAAEARRAVIAPVLAGDDPSASRHGAAVAQHVADMLAGETALAPLPGKFGCLTDAGGVLPLGGIAADVRVMLDGESCRVALDGSWLAAACAPQDAAAVVRALLLAFLALAPDCPAPPRRMRNLVADIGAQAVFTQAGLAAEPAAALAAPDSTVGWVAYSGAGGTFLAAPPFGSLHATTLAALADLSERTADGLLRVTPFRALALCGAGDPATLADAAAALGLLSGPADPRGRVAACPGAPACGAAGAATRADAALLAQSGFSGTLHVSGCAKGCAHPEPAGFVLTAEAGGYALIRHGRAGDPPVLRGLSLPQAAALLRESQTA